MAAPLGNQNAVKGKRWQEALVKALAQYSSDDVEMGQALFKIANKVVVQALDGDKDSIQEIGNRLDGKAPQSVELSGELGTYGYERQPIPVEQRHTDSLARTNGSAANGHST